MAESESDFWITIDTPHCTSLFRFRRCELEQPRSEDACVTKSGWAGSDPGSVLLTTSLHTVSNVEQLHLFSMERIRTLNRPHGRPRVRSGNGTTQKWTNLKLYTPEPLFGSTILNHTYQSVPGGSELLFLLRRDIKLIIHKCDSTLPWFSIMSCDFCSDRGWRCWPENIHTMWEVR